MAAQTRLNSRNDQVLLLHVQSFGVGPQTQQKQLIGGCGCTINLRGER